MIFIIFYGDETHEKKSDVSNLHNLTPWEQQLPARQCEEIDEVIDSRVVRRTTGKEYKEYLIKWRGEKMEEATWVAGPELLKLGIPNPHEYS